MAENKKSFILYCDLIHQVEGLTDDEAGRLIKHLLRYVNDKNPCAEDRLTSIIFEPIKQQLKRDLVKYEGVKVEKSKSGKLGGLKSGEARRKQKEANEASASKTKQKEANEAVNVNVSVIVNEKNIELLKQRSLIFSESIKPFVETYGKDICNAFYRHWSEPTPSKNKMKFELQKTWDVGRRLITWEKNSHAFDKKPKKEFNGLQGIL